MQPLHAQAATDDAPMANGHHEQASPPPPVSYPAGAPGEGTAEEGPPPKPQLPPRASAALGGLPLPSVTSTGSLTLLQHQLAIAEAARDRTNEQLLGSYERAERAEARARELGVVAEGLEVRVRELEAQQGIALELLGERNERVECLEEDIAEMKRIFREQLELAAVQLTSACANNQGGL